MPIIEPDLSEVSGPLEPGTYQAKIVSCDAQTSKSGNPMLKVGFEIDVEDKTVKRTSYPVTSGPGAFNFEQLLRACNFDEVANQLKDGQKIRFDTDDLIGQELNVVIEAAIYNDAPTDQIKSYIRA